MQILTRTDAATAIVNLLEARPNNSCKRSDVAKLTIRKYEITVRGTERSELIQLIKSALTSLLLARIVKSYRAVNARVKLTPDYKERLSSFIRRSSIRDLSSDDRARQSNLIDENASGTFSQTTDDPSTDNADLFGDDDNKADDDADVEDDDEHDSDSESDDEEIFEDVAELTRIGIPELAPPNIESSTVSNLLPPPYNQVTNSHNTAVSLDDVLSNIVTLDGFSVSSSLGVAYIEWHGLDTTLKGELSPHYLPSCLCISIYLPFFEHSALKIIQYISENSFHSALRTGYGPRGKEYILRYHFFVDSVKGAADEVVHAFSEAFKVKVLLDTET